MMSLRTRKIFGLAVLVAVVVAASIDPAFADTTFQPLNTALTDVLSFMTGTFATTAATVAVAAVGYLGSDLPHSLDLGLFRRDRRRPDFRRRAGRLVADQRDGRLMRPQLPSRASILSSAA